MKIKTTDAAWYAVEKIEPPAHKLPKKPGLFFRTLLKLVSSADLKETEFTCDKEIARAGDGPYLILMNHSSFIDLEIMSTVFYPEPISIVCTSDGFVGKEWLMRRLGCIPTQKFVSDYTLIRDMEYALHTLGCHVLMYPEASYSFDGTATPLPRKLGVCLKKLNVPVIYVQTEGAFSRDPLYNGLKKRKVKVSATIRCLFTREELKEKSVAEIDAALDGAFSFDAFRWQRDNKIEINEPFRAEGLERILYRCPICGKEGAMHGAGTSLTCNACGASWELTPTGALTCDRPCRFDHIPDWYAWERETVRGELERGTYRLDCTVKIGVMTDMKSIYMVGNGRLVHSADGFALTGCDGALRYEQTPLSSYGLYADYFWYEIGDVICIGDRRRLYYCFPEVGVAVAKARLAAEELYRLCREKRENERRAPRATATE